jgi:hypothetical protein
MTSAKTIRCTVCDILKPTPNIEKQFNTKLKKKVSVRSVIKDFQALGNVEVPTKYYLEQHRDYCLKDFVIDETISIALPTSKKPELEITDEFIKMSLGDKTKLFQEKLLNMLYVKLTSVDNSITIQKADVDVIKILYDLAYKPYIDLSGFEFTDDKQEVESTGMDLIRKIMSSNIQTESVTLDIVKLLLKNRKGDDGDNPDDDELKEIAVSFIKPAHSIVEDAPIIK